MARYLRFWVPGAFLSLPHCAPLSDSPVPGGSGDCTVEIARRVGGPPPGQHHVPAGAAGLRLAAPRMHAGTQGVPRALRGLGRVLKQKWAQTQAPGLREPSLALV